MDYLSSEDMGEDQYSILSPIPETVPPSAKPEIASGLKKYKLGKQLGFGAFSTVYEAIRVTDEETVAIKAVNCRWTRMELYDMGEERLHLPPRVLREYLTLTAIEHENVIKMIDAFDAGDNEVYFVLEYLPYSLRDVMRRFYLSLNRKKVFVRQMFSALAFLHSRGVIHRDVKPENILITSDSVLKLADFGLCCRSELPEGASHDMMIGTRIYRAPELVFGSRKYSQSVDVFAGALVAFELFTSHSLIVARDDISHAVKLVKLFDVPDINLLPDVEILFPDYTTMCFDLAKIPSMTLKHRLRIFAQEQQEFFISCLEFHPYDRISAMDAKHSGFLSKGVKEVMGKFVEKSIRAATTKPESTDSFCKCAASSLPVVKAQKIPDDRITKHEYRIKMTQSPLYKLPVFESAEKRQHKPSFSPTKPRVRHVNKEETISRKFHDLLPPLVGRKLKIERSYENTTMSSRMKKREKALPKRLSLQPLEQPPWRI